jgi:hypothetical protein
LNNPYRVRELYYEITLKELMNQFDIEREKHRRCKKRIHYITMRNEKLCIVHSGSLDQKSEELFMGANKIFGVFFSESQRETLISRIKAYLKGNS